MQLNRKILHLLVSTGLAMTLLTGCMPDITPTLVPAITNELTPTFVPTEEPTPTLSPTPFVGTLDQEYRYRIELLDSTDGSNVQVALKDLDLTAKGQSDPMKDLLTANFLAWFKKGSFPRRETTINRFGDTDFKVTCTDETIATLNVLLKGSALIAYPENPEGIYVLPAIYMIPDLAPNAMTDGSKLFFGKYKKLEEQHYLLWGRDGPQPEIDFIYESLGYWEKYCESIKNSNGTWSFPTVAGLPPPWNPDGMLRMLRMKLITNDLGTYMFRLSDDKLSENYRYFFSKYIETYPKSDTAELLRRYMKAMEDAGWIKNIEATAILSEYRLVYREGVSNPENPYYMMDIQ